MCMVLCSGVAVTQSSVDAVGHVGHLPRLSREVVHSPFARVAGLIGIVTEVNETGA